MKYPTLEIDGTGEDYDLMEGLVRQQPGALAELHTRYAQVLHHWVLQIVHDHADADDVVQDVFVQLWTRPECYCRAKGKPFGWLLTIARRRAIDCLRRRTSYRRATDRFEILSRPPLQTRGREQNVAQDASKNDLRQYLLELMMQLPTAQQAVVERSFFGQMSQRQIAAAMKLPLGTIKTRMELGLKKLARAALPLRARIDGEPSEARCTPA